MAEGGVAGHALEDRRLPWDWNAPRVLERKAESERFEPSVMRILSRVFQCDVVKTDRIFDLDKAADLRLRAMLRDLVGCKMISAGIASQWPEIFRCRWMPDVGNELTKWIQGYPHWLFIGHKAKDGIVGWYILDMDVVRKALASPQVRFVLRKGVKDPTSWYLSFNVMDFPREAIVASGGTMEWLGGWLTI